MKLRILAVSILVIASALVFAQADATKPSKAPVTSATNVPPKDLADIVAKQFGPDFQIVTQAPSSKIVGATTMDSEQLAWNSVLTGDLDGDGVEDVVIVAHNKNATIGAEAFHYKVVDAYNDHFGYGNPNVTVDFNANDPLHNNLILLVIHGAGAEAWRAATPKAKYVLINVPFMQVALTRSRLKKVTTDAIRVEESDTVSSVIFWDGKKYRYLPGGGTL